MRPTWAERSVLLAIYLGAGGVTLLAAFAIRWLVPRARSIRLVVFVAASAAVCVAAVAVGLSSGFMFSSSHDLRLLAIALALGVGLALALSFTVSRPLTSDLERLANVAQRVGEGERSLDTGVTRADEVGVVATAMDMMVDRLTRAETEAETASDARCHFLAAISTICERRCRRSPRPSRRSRMGSSPIRNASTGSWATTLRCSEASSTTSF